MTALRHALELRTLLTPGGMVCEPWVSASWCRKTCTDTTSAVQLQTATCSAALIEGHSGQQEEQPHLEVCRPQSSAQDLSVMCEPDTAATDRGPLPAPCLELVCPGFQAALLTQTQLHLLWRHTRPAAAALHLQGGWHLTLSDPLLEVLRHTTRSSVENSTSDHQATKGQCFIRPSPNLHNCVQVWFPLLGLKMREGSGWSLLGCKC